MQDNTQPLFVSSKTFARLTDTPIGTVRFWIARGVIPSVRIGGSVRIPMSALENLTAENEQE